MTSARTFLEIRASYASDWEVSVLADVQSVCSDGDNLLHRVAFKGNREDVRDLVALGADPNVAGDMGNTALHYAAMNGHLLVALALLDSGARLRPTNELGQTPADCAGLGKHFQLEAVLRRSQK
jgi:ankyrin repeat protein